MGPKRSKLIIVVIHLDKIVQHVTLQNIDALKRRAYYSTSVMIYYLVD